jgi:hypothetical protein
MEDVIDLLVQVWMLLHGVRDVVHRLRKVDKTPRLPSDVLQKPGEQVSLVNKETASARPIDVGVVVLQELERPHVVKDLLACESKTVQSLARIPWSPYEPEFEIRN